MRPDHVARWYGGIYVLLILLLLCGVVKIIGFHWLTALYTLGGIVTIVVVPWLIGTVAEKIDSWLVRRSNS